jgi:lipopolysaccharide transport system permease protein
MSPRHEPTEVEYTPESELRRPGRLLTAMWRDLRRSRSLAWRLMVRDIRAAYRQSFFGIAWAFLPPLVMTLGFTLAGKAGVINVASTDLPYPAYVIFSMILWQTFVEAMNGPVLTIASAKPLLARVKFPYEALVVAKLGEVGFNFAIKLTLLIAVFVWYDLPLSWSALLAPLALVQLILFGTLIGLFLAPLGALCQDVAHGLTVFTGLWLFLTPVVYPVPTAGTFATIVGMNPVTPLLVTTRELATTGAVSDPVTFFAVSGATMLGLCVTWIAFRLTLPFVIERASA